MSVLSDIFNLLDDESNAFAFLPTVNYAYLYWKTPSPTPLEAGIAVFSLVVSAVCFNILSGFDFEYYNAADDRKLPIRVTISFIILGVLWVSLLMNSLVSLYNLLSNDAIWPILLLSVSLAFLVVLAIDITLRIILNKYPKT